MPLWPQIKHRAAARVHGNGECGIADVPGVGSLPPSCNLPQFLIQGCFKSISEVLSEERHSKGVHALKFTAQVSSLALLLHCQARADGSSTATVAVSVESWPPPRSLIINLTISFWFSQWVTLKASLLMGDA